MSDMATSEVSRAEFARLVHVSRAAVTIAAKEGRFTGDAIGKGKNLRLPAALEQWKANRDQRGLGVREIDEDPDDDDEDLGPVATTKPVEGSVAAEKARAYRLRADKLELENAVARGELIGRDVVNRGLQDAGGKIATLIDAMPGKAEELAALATGDTAAMRAALRDLAYTLRVAIADRLENAVDSTEADDDDGE